MMRSFAFAAGLAAVSLLGFAPADSAQAARFHDPALQAPSPVEDVACRTVRERVVRPNGSIVFRTKRNCGPGMRAFGRQCQTVRERVVRPNGAVVYRTKRRCG
jgi:hypothetical protein